MVSCKSNNGLDFLDIEYLYTNFSFAWTVGTTAIMFQIILLLSKKTKKQKQKKKTIAVIIILKQPL